MAKKKQQIEVVEFTEAEKKALEIFQKDHSHVLIEIQVLQDRIIVLQKKIYELNDNSRKTNDQNIKYVQNYVWLTLTLKMESDIIKIICFSNYMMTQENKQQKKQKGQYKEKMIKLEKEKTEQDIRYKDELQKINEELKKRSHFKDEKENLIKEIHDLKEEMIKKDYAHKKILIFNQIQVLKRNKLKNIN